MRDREGGREKVYSIFLPIASRSWCKEAARVRHGDRLCRSLASHALETLKCGNSYFS